LGERLALVLEDDELAIAELPGVGKELGEREAERRLIVDAELLPVGLERRLYFDTAVAASRRRVSARGWRRQADANFTGTRNPPMEDLFFDHLHDASRPENIRHDS
jgi:uncharacterized protein (DUF2336 family)